MGHNCHPRIDSRTQLVYLPGLSSLQVFHFEDKHLVRVKSLNCLKEATTSVAINPSDSNSVFVCTRGWTHPADVFQINVTENRVMRKLQAPLQVRPPEHVAVVGQTVLVAYGSSTLVMYHNCGTTPGHVLETPEQLVGVTNLTPYQHSNFLVTTGIHLFILDTQGKLIHALRSTEILQDCDVTQSELLTGYRDGLIMVLSSL